jgi:hypothetical protein
MSQPELTWLTHHPCYENKIKKKIKLPKEDLAKKKKNLNKKYWKIKLELIRDYLTNPYSG